MQSVYESLAERGFIAQCTDVEELPKLLAGRQVTVYCGFDPTADSLHLGTLVPMMGLSHFQRAGHRVLIIVGGATGMVGDPSGRSDERSLLTDEQVTANVEAVKRQLAHFFEFEGDNPAKLLNNNDWIGSMSFVDWLREVGKYFTINYMLAKDSVARRLESEQGISFTEFSYMTMQAYDFLHLYDAEGCTLQCGATDQWGNITAGIDLIRRRRQAAAYGLTFPLVTAPSGEKYGKSAGNAVWLDAKRTTPWDFYQCLVRQEDREVVHYLKIYTFLPIEQIDALAQSMQAAPEKREAQKALAFEVTRIVHGEETAREIARAAEVVYQSEIKDLSDGTLSAIFADVPSTEVATADLDRGIDPIELLARTGLAKSKSEARRLIKSGGAYVNNVRLTDEVTINRSHLASESFIVLRSGKKNYHLLRVTSG
ncbi:MAG TPA: tyrosine--tRNA ligase [Phycisphaerae bacterium]|nr:tyrosine--tRNA ligase [Phycisphaerae bacterium]